MAQLSSAITHITQRNLITVDEVFRKWAIRFNAGGKWLVAALQVLHVSDSMAQETIYGREKKMCF